MLAAYTTSFVEFLRTNYSDIPLTWFTLLGSFLEEIIAPIPSPVVLTLAGSLAAAQNRGWFYLFLIAVTGSVGKTIASYFIYILADKAEDFIFNKIGKYIGLSHKSVENAGKHLNKGIRDDIVLTFLRAFPIIPTIPVSVACGLVKLNMRTYIVSTFVGTILRNIFYITVGYTGINATENLIVKMEDYEVAVYVVLIISVCLMLGFMYFKNKKHKSL